jgi:hypothetical protein
VKVTTDVPDAVGNFTLQIQAVSSGYTIYHGLTGIIDGLYCPSYLPKMFYFSGGSCCLASTALLVSSTLLEKVAHPVAPLLGSTGLALKLSGNHLLAKANALNEAPSITKMTAGLLVKPEELL